jgi:hypothetical protein
MIALCIGRKEQGKTTLGYHLAKTMPTRIVFDPREHFFTSLCVTENANGLYELLDDQQEIIVKPPDHYPEHFELVCEQLRAWIKDNREEEFALLVDESYDVKTPDFMPPALDWLMRKTKRKQVRIIFTAHRPVDVATDIRALSDNWFIFQTTQEHDLKIIAERCGREVAEQVSTLKAREFINWDDSIGVWKKFSDSSKWYVSLGEGAARIQSQGENENVSTGTAEAASDAAASNTRCADFAIGKCHGNDAGSRLR